MGRLISSNKPRASKKHTCDLCCEAIWSSMRYLRQKGCDDAGTYVFKAHEGCWAVVEASHPRFFDDDGAFNGELADVLGDMTLDQVRVIAATCDQAAMETGRMEDLWYEANGVEVPW